MSIQKDTKMRRLLEELRNVSDQWFHKKIGKRYPLILIVPPTPEYKDGAFVANVPVTPALVSHMLDVVHYLQLDLEIKEIINNNS